MLATAPQSGVSELQVGLAPPLPPPPVEVGDPLPPVFEGPEPPEPPPDGPEGEPVAQVPGAIRVGEALAQAHTKRWVSFGFHKSNIYGSLDSYLS